MAGDLLWLKLTIPEDGGIDAVPGTIHSKDKLFERFETIDAKVAPEDFMDAWGKKMQGMIISS